MIIHLLSSKHQGTTIKTKEKKNPAANVNTQESYTPSKSSLYHRRQKNAEENPDVLPSLGDMSQFIPVMRNL